MIECLRVWMCSSMMMCAYKLTISILFSLSVLIQSIKLRQVMSRSAFAKAQEQKWDNIAEAYIQLANNE